MITDAHIVRLWGMRCGMCCVVRCPFEYHCHFCTLYKMCMSLEGIWVILNHLRTMTLLGNSVNLGPMQCLSTAGRSVEAVSLVTWRDALQGNISIQDISRCLARKNHMCMGMLSME